jgi:hypothetical protein
VTLGYTVCADTEYADVCIRDMRFGMGASVMMSGRRPSMLRMITRCIAGRDVSVGDGSIVGLGVNVSVGTEILVEVDCRAGDNVNIGVGVKVSVDNWHAIRSASRTA